MKLDLPRAEWGARPPNRGYVTAGLDRPGVEFHHTVGTYGAHSLMALLRAIQADHLGRGWTDGFYNIVIWYDGSIGELRPLWARSGPIPDLTVVFPGNYNTRELTDEQEQAAQRVREFVVRSGGGSRVRWHGQRGGSSCPGSNVIRWLQAGLPDPTPQEEFIVREQDIDTIRRIVREENERQRAQLERSLPSAVMGWVHQGSGLSAAFAIRQMYRWMKAARGE